MSENLQLPARIVKEGEIVRSVASLTITIKVNSEAFEEAQAAAAAFRRAYPVRRVVPGLEHLDDGAIDVEPNK